VATPEPDHLDDDAATSPPGHSGVPESKSKRARISLAAFNAGHRLSTVRKGGRVHVWCCCGWKAGAKGSFRQLISEATDHAMRAGLTAMGVVPAGGEIPAYEGPYRSFGAEIPPEIFAEDTPRRGSRKSSVPPVINSSEG